MKKLFYGRRLIFALIVGIFAFSIASTSLTPTTASAAGLDETTFTALAAPNLSSSKAQDPGKDNGKLCERLTDHIHKLEARKDKLQHRLDALNDRLAKAKTEDEKERLNKRITVVKDHLEHLNKRLDALRDKKTKHNCSDK